jgi:diphthine synthase
MLYLIGLGLHDEEDLSLKAIDALKKCDSIFCELYTNKWHGNLNKIEDMTGKKIQVLPREKVESDFIVNESKNKVVALLIPGDPLTATTHIELLIEAKKQKINFQIIHSSSIYTAVAESGLMIYKFGRTTTLAYPEKDYEPKSPYEVVKENKKASMHTLVLLDIKEDKSMTVKDGVELLLKNKAIGKNEKIVACCELGSKHQVIRYDSASNLVKDLPVPAVLIIPGRLNFKEEEALALL